MIVHLDILLLSQYLNWSSCFSLPLSLYLICTQYLQNQHEPITVNIFSANCTWKLPFFPSHFSFFLTDIHFQSLWIQWSLIFFHSKRRGSTLSNKCFQEASSKSSFYSKFLSDHTNTITSSVSQKNSYNSSLMPSEV